MEEDGGILKFVRGLDLSQYKSDDLIFSRLSKLENLRWIKLNSINLNNIPDISSLKMLEYLSLKNNKISSLDIHGTWNNISTLNFSRNCIKNDENTSSNPDHDIDTAIFDLSFNDLEMLPTCINCMTELSMLNITHNKITKLHLKTQKELLFLDASYNKICDLDISACQSLQYLNLSYNPLDKCVFENVSNFEHVTTLELSGLDLEDEDIERILSRNNLRCLNDLNISYNNVAKISPKLFQLETLCRLNISNNNLSELHESISCLKNLRLINVSFNCLTKLPESIGKLQKLTRIYANSNEITGDGLPETMADLPLEVIMLAFNKIESYPHALCRIQSLKRLILRNNKLLTLPEAILDLKQLETLDVKGNDDFMMPKKKPPIEDPYAKMDFSYENVRDMVYTLIKQQLPPQEVAKGDVTKQKMIVHRKTRFEKMEEIQVAEANKAKNVQQPSEPSSSHPKSGKVTDESRKKMAPQLFKHNMLDCNEVYSDTVGQSTGITVFIIEKFSPSIVEDFSTFYRGDCFVVLNSYHEENVMKHKIYFWIGSKSSIDKKTCAAMHAVNLKNFLGLDSSTIREEEADESEEFLKLFPFGIEVVDGQHVPSALYDTSTLTAYQCVMYRISIINQSVKIEINKVPLSLSSLDPKFVFILIDRNDIYLYNGKTSKLVLRNKASLFAEKFNQHERKNSSKITNVSEADGSDSPFWKILSGESVVKNIEVGENPFYNTINRNKPVLYLARLGSGYLELPQVESIAELKRSDLSTESVYIVDMWDDIYVWCGRKTAKILREAARRLAVQLKKFFVRSSVCEVKLLSESTHEDFIFTTRLFGWSEEMRKTVKVPVAATKPPPAPVKKLLTHDDFNLPKLDLANIFMSRPSALSLERSQLFLDAIDEYLEKLDCFVFDSKTFVKMPDLERGQFYSGDCYVFLCKNVVPVVKATQPEESINLDEEDEVMEYETETKYKVFFWEGLDCSKTGFLTFAFSLQKQFEQLFGDKLSIERVLQQQEPYEFLALFHPNFIVHRGNRPSSSNLQTDPTISMQVRFYQIRSTSGILTLRCVQIDNDPKLLCSKLHYLLVLPSVSSTSSVSCVGEKETGTIYLWIGSKIDENESNSAELIVQSLKLYLGSYSVVEVHEGNEPDVFWEILGGKAEYDTDGLYLSHSRMFRCTNEAGFFAAREKFLDFCQTDLLDDDVMMVDTGSEVFIWEGIKASDTEKTFTHKIAPIYIKHCHNLHWGKPRKLITIKPGYEPIEFERVFHGFRRDKYIHYIQKR